MALDTDWRLFDHDPVTGKTVYMRFDGGQVKVRTVMPVDEMVEENAAQRSVKAGTAWGDGLEHVARVPMHVWQRQLAEPIMQEDEKAVARWLNDPENRAFRSRDGKL